MSERKEYGDRHYITTEQADAICKILGIENKNFCTIVTQPHGHDVREHFEYLKEERTEMPEEMKQALSVLELEQTVRKGVKAFGLKFPTPEDEN